MGTAVEPCFQVGVGAIEQDGRQREGIDGALGVVIGGEDRSCVGVSGVLELER